MEIKNNCIKESLKNVYFVTGTPCGGKTTISRALSQRYGYPVYDVDQEFPRHKSLSNSIDQPAMNQEFPNADAFFLRPYREYAKWLLQNTREQLDFIILDLIRLSQHQPVFCDLHLTVEQVMKITEPQRVVFLIKNPDNLMEEYANRPDHQDFSEYLNSASDPQLAKENCNRALAYFNRQRYDSIRSSSYFWLEREKDSTVENTLRLVAKHFGLPTVE